MSADAVLAAIRQAVPQAEVHATDLKGGDHWFVVVVSPSFEGQRPLARQRPILDACTPLIEAGLVHALDLKCITPAELEARFGGRLPDAFPPHGDGMPGMHRP